MIMTISGIYSLSEEIYNSESGISTGAIDIEIEELNKDNQPFDEDGNLVMPGDEIILIPKINNLGEECYLRAKIEFIIDNEVFEVTDYIDGDYTSWSKKDDYYYYNSTFSKKDSTILFNKVTIPDLSSDYYGKTVAVHIIVEAVQAKHFNGDWDSVRIKKSIDRRYDIDYEGMSNVIYEDFTNHHINLDDEFFNKLGNMLPGDSFSETVRLLNKGDSKNEYYFSIDYKNLSSEELELLENIKLIVKNQSGVLGIYKKGEGDIFRYEIFLPEDIDNDFSKLSTKIKWNFSYKAISKVLPAHEESNPKTGDYGINMSIIIFIFSSIGLLLVLLIWKKENIENNE